MASEQDKAITDQEASAALAAFGQAGILVALDCEPGGDDDIARSMYGVKIEGYSDSGADDEGRQAIAITLADGRGFLVSIMAERFPDADRTPDQAAADAAIITEERANDAGHAWPDTGAQE